MKLLYLITLSCLLLSCGKNKTEPKQEVPQRTTSGANILVCKVNGELHIYDDGMFTWNNPEGIVYEKRSNHRLGSYLYICQ